MSAPSPVTEVNIALVGDYTPSAAAHQAIPLALAYAASALDVQLTFQWQPTAQIGDGGGLQAFNGIWCVPASPYEDMQGALTAIRVAREQGIAFLGTCGGFQHALIEYARHRLGWRDAEHGESSTQAERAIITPLSCALLDVMGPIHLSANSRLARAYGRLAINERYQCRYGLREGLHAEMFAGPLHSVGVDPHGAVRAVELQDHPFFVATLFQPERAALQGICPPLIKAFVAAALANARHQHH